MNQILNYLKITIFPLFDKLSLQTISLIHRIEQMRIIKKLYYKKRIRNIVINTIINIVKLIYLFVQFNIVSYEGK